MSRWSEHTRRLQERALIEGEKRLAYERAMREGERAIAAIRGEVEGVQHYETSPINRIIIVRADGSREEIRDEAFFVSSVTIKFPGRSKGTDCRTETRT
jgi:hypothetical protein